MTKKLLVKKSGYHRKGYMRGKTYVEPTYVGPTTFKVKDRGAPGRGPRVLPTLRTGTLGGSGFFGLSDAARKKKLVGLANKHGLRVVAGKLRAVQVLEKRTNPVVSRKAAADAKWLFDYYRKKR
jgi:hypothetical protein